MTFAPGIDAHDGDLGTVLAVFAHPDDEAYLAGGLMVVAADAGRRVVCVTAAKGEGGFPDDDNRSADERARVRADELRSCLDVLGVREHRWLGYPDGGCADVDDAEAVAQVRAVVDEVRPDVVLTFGPDGQTYHPDHIAVSRWTTHAVRTADADPDLLYAVMTPEWVEAFTELVPMDHVMMTDDPPPTVPASELALWFWCDDVLAARKVAALRCQASQVEPLVAMGGLDAYTLLTRDEFYRRATASDWSDSSG